MFNQRAMCNQTFINIVTNDFIKSTSQELIIIRITLYKTKSTMTPIESNITHKFTCSMPYQLNKNQVAQSK
jgi:hypothetical protein